MLSLGFSLYHFSFVFLCPLFSSFSLVFSFFAFSLVLIYFLCIFRLFSRSRFGTHGPWLMIWFIIFSDGSSLSIYNCIGCIYSYIYQLYILIKLFYPGITYIKWPFSGHYGYFLLVFVNIGLDNDTVAFILVTVLASLLVFANTGLVTDMI